MTLVEALNQVDSQQQSLNNNNKMPKVLVQPVNKIMTMRVMMIRMFRELTTQ